MSYMYDKQPSPLANYYKQTSRGTCRSAWAPCELLKRNIKKNELRKQPSPLADLPGLLANYCKETFNLIILRSLIVE